MRIIDADVLIVELQKDEERFDKEAEDAKDDPSYTESYSEAMWSRANGIRDAIVEVYDAPSIDIVRCKECKRWSYSDLIESHNRCERTLKLTKADDFCSYGVCKTNTTAEEKPTPIRDYMVHGERKESE